MHVTFAPNGILQIDGARIVFRNFAGAQSKFNAKGDRNFAVVIPNQEIADALTDAGWTVKVKPPREEGDEPFMFMKVKLQFNDRGPIAYLKTGNNLVRLDEESIECLDNVEIACVDMDLRPYNWEVNGKTGRTAWLHSIRVTQAIQDRFAEEEYPGERPW